MTFDELVKQRVIEPCRMSDEEIADHLHAAKHDIDFGALIAGQDLDWAFTITYNGILQTALAFMYEKGFRPRGEAKHYDTFRFLGHALPPDYADDISRLQKLRSKRNQAVYQSRGIVSEREAKDVFAFARRFYEEIVSLLPADIQKMASGEEAES
jgi:hypothetical protein